MAKLSLEECKEDILNKLREVGAKGLPKSKLTAGDSSKKKTEAFKDLEKNLQIVNVGSESRTRYVLQEFNKPTEITFDLIEKKAVGSITLENAYEFIEKKAAGKMMLFSQTALFSDFPSSKKIQKKTIDWLVKEKKLLNLKYGKNTVYLHISAVQSFLPSVQTEPEKKMSHPELSREQVFAAYLKVKARTGFSNVEIYELQRELGVDMEAVKTFLLEESRQGRAVLSLGDWSLSSEETRSGVIEIQGNRYLLVRLNETDADGKSVAKISF